MVHSLLSRIVILFRLAVIVSLVGYTLPNANAAMHGSALGNLQIQAVVQDDGHDEDHVAAEVDHGMDHTEAGHHGGNDDAAGKSAKPDCCQDFCVSMALPVTHDVGGRIAVSSIRHFADDSKALGQIPVLNRPPNI